MPSYSTASRNLAPRLQAPRLPSPIPHSRHQDHGHSSIRQTTVRTTADTSRLTPPPLRRYPFIKPYEQMNYQMRLATVGRAAQGQWARQTACPASTRTPGGNWTELDTLGKILSPLHWAKSPQLSGNDRENIKSRPSPTSGAGRLRHLESAVAPRQQSRMSGNARK